MSIEHRIRQLETTIEPPSTNEPLVIVYSAGEQPPTAPDDSRVRLYLPDNGRGCDRESDQCTI